MVCSTASAKLRLVAALCVCAGALDAKAGLRRFPVTVTENPVRIDVYYESMCPDCQKLITAGLAQVMGAPDFRDRVQLVLYPYGNGQSLHKNKVSEGYRFFHPELNEAGMDYIFVCQHGPDECKGNMIQACIIQEYPKVDQHFPIIQCMESRTHDSFEKSSYECAQSAGLNLDTTRSCYNSSKGNKYMAALGEATQKLESKTYVPWVVIDGQHNEQAERGGILPELCKALTPPLPEACRASALMSMDSKLDEFGAQRTRKANSTKTWKGCSAADLEVPKL